MIFLFSSLTGVMRANLTSANLIPPTPPELPRTHTRSNGNIKPTTVPIQQVGDTDILMNKFA
jgi:hypothetical protein